MKFTKNFSELAKGDANIAGGKGASLGEMSKAGIPVPGGFVVLSTTFDYFIKETDLAQEIDAILDAVDHKVIHTVDSASEKIRGLIEGQDFPKDIAKEVLSEYKKMSSKFVAVRSSATVEDGAEHAWAGQLESFLNTEEETILLNVKKCWASLFTPRAIFYRFEKGLHGTEISVAVVVQKMIQSEISGIAFSVHPVTEDYNQLIIEAGFGLGEAIVSGSITPDSYVVEKEPRRIIDINVNTQVKMLVRDRVAGNKWEVIPEASGSLQVLNEAQILKLTEIVMKIENHYGFPCDIEWAYEDGKFYIVQSRPITTLTNKKKDNTDFKIPEREKYDLTFESQGTQFIFEDLVAEFYDFPDTITLCRDGIKSSYVSKNILKQMNKKGLRLSITDLQKITTSLDKTIKQAIKETLEYKKKKDFSKSDATHMFEIMAKICKEYLYFDFGYWDETFKKSQTDKKIKEKVDLVQNNKNKIRAELDPIFFGDGYLPVLVDKTSESTGVSKDDLCWYKYFEILDLFDGTRVTEEEIKKRKEKYVYYKDADSKVIFYSGDLAGKFILDFLKNEKNTLNPGGIIKGVSAHSNGKVVRGKVKLLVRDFSNQKAFLNEMEKMNVGDILVSQTTDPELMPAIRKAGAILTDIGGLLSHSAIVSRELNIPCIIDTKNASKLLKDGDMVEVDANNGVVRIISNTN
jgi:phosphoenolpyruvate synthase/pyruvate phosphate dikinase